MFSDEVYLAGGAVRDMLDSRPLNDLNYVVFGIALEEKEEELNK